MYSAYACNDNINWFVVFVSSVANCIPALSIYIVALYSYIFSYSYGYICMYELNYESLMLSVGSQEHQIVKDRVGKQTKVLKSFSTAEPNVQIKSLSNNPNSKEFLGF